MPSSKATVSLPPTRPKEATTKRQNLATVVTLTTLRLLALSLATYATRNGLAPLFGSTAASQFPNKIVITTAVLATVAPKIRPRTASLISSSLLCAAPATLYWAAVMTARLGDPVLGALLSYALVLAPILYLGSNILQVTLFPAGIIPRSLHVVTLSLGTCFGIIQTQNLWSSYLPKGRIFNASYMLISAGWILALTGTTMGPNRGKSIALAETWLSRNRLSLLIAFGMTMFSLSQPPTRSLKLPYVDPSGHVRILSTTPSVTGQIVVAENLKEGFRYLRADHSLLGGVWIGDGKLAKMNKETPWLTDKDGVKLGDSIYSAFVLQEAVRLQETSKIQKNALIIGLGAGIAAQAFIQHGISTSVVEIDPAVYGAARDYFGVGKPTSVYLEDARGWVSQRAASRNETYDIVVHDCFSGGGVPQHIFTAEFWKDLRASLDPEGIVAVNFAGMIGGDPSKAILITLQKSFGQCRVFHDYHTGMTDKDLTSEFINMVFFCTPSSDPLKFRKASVKDYLSSYLREHVLSALPEREVDVVLIKGNVTEAAEADWILTDSKNSLGEWQEAAAMDHWKVMRNIMPDLFWETY